MSDADYVSEYPIPREGLRVSHANQIPLLNHRRKPGQSKRKSLTVCAFAKQLERSAKADLADARHRVITRLSEHFDSAQFPTEALYHEYARVDERLGEKLRELRKRSKLMQSDVDDFQRQAEAGIRTQRSLIDALITDVFSRDYFLDSADFDSYLIEAMAPLAESELASVTSSPFSDRSILTDDLAHITAHYYQRMAVLHRAFADFYAYQGGHCQFGHPLFLEPMSLYDADPSSSEVLLEVNLAARLFTYDP